MFSSLSIQISYLFFIRKCLCSGKSVSFINTDQFCICRRKWRRENHYVTLQCVRAKTHVILLSRFGVRPASVRVSGDHRGAVPAQTAVCPVAFYSYQTDETQEKDDGHAHNGDQQIQI